MARKFFGIHHPLMASTALATLAIYGVVNCGRVDD